MKTLEIKIKSREQADAEFRQAFKGAPSRKNCAAKSGVFFTSLEAVRTLLTDKRLELLHLIRQHSPRSINHLASIAGRDFKNVHTDIKLLEDYGLIQLSRRGKANKTASQTISLPYQAINIHAMV
jgi:predicted transcriptional regulator